MKKLPYGMEAANRDPAVFKDPNSFNILRENADKHLAFGIGRHTCLASCCLDATSRILFTIFDSFP